MDVVGLYEAKMLPDALSPVCPTNAAPRPPPTPYLITEVELQEDGSKVGSVP